MRLSPRRRLFVGGVALVVLAALTGVLVRATHGDGGVRSGYPSQASPGPVLLVPGYGGRVGSLSELADRIRATGRSATVVPLPDGGTGDLTVQADALQAAARQAIDGGAGSVDVVGYSAGGVVVRLWVAQDGGAHEARRIVTLGAPLHGTRLAAVGSAVLPGACPTACQQLATGSSLVAKLGRTRLPARLPWLSVWTEDDQTVTPPDSARLTGAVNVPLQTLCPGAHVQHTQLPHDPRVLGLAVRALGAAPLSAPRPADCT